MAKKKYRVTQHGLNISDENGQIRELQVGEEITMDNLPQFWLAKVEEVKGEDKKLEVATPSEDGDKPKKASK
jgi:hypothetical protein